MKIFVVFIIILNLIYAGPLEEKYSKECFHNKNFPYFICLAKENTWKIDKEKKEYILKNIENIEPFLCENQSYKETLFLLACEKEENREFLKTMRRLYGDKDPDRVEKNVYNVSAEKTWSCEYPEEYRNANLNGYKPECIKYKK